jgi:hypothetical protein
MSCARQAFPLGADQRFSLHSRDDSVFRLVVAAEVAEHAPAAGGAAAASALGKLCVGLREAHTPLVARLEAPSLDTRRDALRELRGLLQLPHVLRTLKAPSDLVDLRPGNGKSSSDRGSVMGRASHTAAKALAEGLSRPHRPVDVGRVWTCKPADRDAFTQALSEEDERKLELDEAEATRDVMEQLGSSAEVRQLLQALRREVAAASAAFKAAAAASDAAFEKCRGASDAGAPREPTQAQPTSAAPHRLAAHSPRLPRCRSCAHAPHA